MRAPHALAALLLVSHATAQPTPPTCANTYSGLTKCAILNGATTTIDTGITRNLNWYIDGWYRTQLESGMSDSIACRAAFDAFHCVFVVSTLYGGSPCDSDGNQQQPCYSLCVNYVQQCYGSTSSRNRNVDFALGFGPRQIDVPGTDNVEAICSHYEPFRFVEKCFGGEYVANVTIETPPQPPTLPPTTPQPLVTTTPQTHTPPASTPPPSTPPPSTPIPLPPVPSAAVKTATAWGTLVLCAVCPWCVRSACS
jgi:hypothetical protein